MIELDAVHPPTCATTLTVSLGLLSTPQSVATIVVGIVIPIGTHRVADTMFTEMYGDDPTDMDVRS